MSAIELVIEVKSTDAEPWVWHSWLSGRFQHRPIVVRIQQWAIFNEHLISVFCIRKEKIKIK